MPPRTTFSGSSPSPVDGDVFLNEYAQRLKSLFDAAAFPLTAVAGTGNAVTASLDPPLDPGGLVNGMKFTITWAAANTGAVTLAINGGTAVPVVDADNVALAASALAAGRRSLIEFVGSAFRILSSAGGGAAGAGPTYQAFTTSGTWTRPTGYDPDTVVLIEVWGGGGGGGRGNSSTAGGGGGGGGYARRYMRIADVPSSVTVTIGAGGLGSSVVASGGVGGTTSFGSLLSAFGGGGGNASNITGGGGGGEFAAGVTPVGLQDGTGGAIGGGSSLLTPAVVNPNTIFGGGAGGISGAGGTGGRAVHGGGGGGGGGAANAGGSSLLGGAGGAGGTTGTAGSGTAPGGGGGGSSAGTSGAGARGECRIWIFG